MQAAAILSLLIAVSHALTLPSIHNYLLTHKSPADLAALDYAQQDITDEPIVEIVDVTEPTALFNEETTHYDVTRNHNTPGRKLITIEPSEPSQTSNLRDIDDSHENSEIVITNEERNGTDTDKLVEAESIDSEVKIRVPVNSVEETPQLPKLSTWFKPDTKPKPLNLPAGSGIKTVYVRVSSVQHTLL